MSVGHTGEQQKRKIVLDPSGSMNIYLVLDGSDSIGARNFTGAKKCLAALIEKVEPLLQCGTLSGLTALTGLASWFAVPPSPRVSENPLVPAVLLPLHLKQFLHL